LSDAVSEDALSPFCVDAATEVVEGGDVKEVGGVVLFRREAKAFDVLLAVVVTVGGLELCEEGAKVKGDF